MQASSAKAFAEIDGNGVISIDTGGAGCDTALCIGLPSIFSASADPQDQLPVPLTVEQRETNRASIDFVWGMIQMKGKSYSDTFCSRSKDNCATVDGYPGPNSHSELKFAKIVEELPKVPRMEETGKIRRLGDLGYLIMNDLLWTKDWKTFPIGADFGDHRKARPIADALQGKSSKAWNTKIVRASVAEFFKDRTQLTYADYSGWSTKFFHKIMLDIDLSADEVKEFENFKSSVTAISVLPRWLVKTFRWALSLKKAQNDRDKWILKYELAMEADKRGIIPADIAKPTTDEKKRDRRFLADLIVTSITSAGGLSTPSVMQLCLAVLYSGANSPLAEAERTLTPKTLRPFVYETIRRFPVVVGFPWWSPDQTKRTVLNLAMALRDPDAWSDALKFKIRPLSEYHKKAGSGTKIGVAWAEQSMGPDGELTADSRGCPGQELSMVMITEFLRAMMGKQGDWYVSKMPEGGIKITEGPSTASSFTLTKGSPAPVTYTPLSPPRAPLTDKEEAQVREELAEAAEGQGGASSAKFHCPFACGECCQKEKWGSSSWYHRQDTTKFHCIIAADKAAGFKIDGRTCTKAVVREEDATQAVATCDLTPKEVEAKLHADLHKCTYHKLVISFGAFLGRDRLKDYCTVSYAGTLFGLRAIGGAIESQLFTVSDSVSGGVSGTKASEFANAGTLDKLCAGASCQKPTATQKGCENAEKASLKNMLNGDISNGRNDRVSMAIWAGIAGGGNQAKNFPKPEQTRMLKKFVIPGWSSKKVVYEVLDGDSPIKLLGGGFQCMVDKILENKVDDDFGSGRNEYASGSGVLSQEAWVSPQQFGRRRRTQPQCTSLPAISAPAKSTDVRNAYFDRYGLYQTLLHFDVPAGELQSDKTLERFVFEAIGAHHLEPIVDGKLINLSPISIAGLPKERTALPHCPQDARYVVRMEGLFEKTPLRTGMANWGGNAFFTATGNILAIQYFGKTVVKGDKDWEAYKFFFRSSLSGMVTAFDHLVSTHILVSNALAVASQEALTEDHPLRHILTPHTWATLKINMQASTVLFPKNMLLHRVVPFADEAFEAADGGDGKLWAMTSGLRFTKFMDLYAKYVESKGKITGAPEIPFFEDGALLHKTFHDYFKSVVALIYSEDATQCTSKLIADERAQAFLKNFWSQTEGTPDFYPAEFKPEEAGKDCGKFTDLLTELVFHVTGVHKHVGTVADFLRDSSFVAPAWVEGETQARPKQAMLMMLLAASTAADYPKLDQGLCDIYSNDVRYRDLFVGLKTGMQATQKEVETRNEARVAAGRLAFHQMEPKYLEWGVQV